MWSAAKPLLIPEQDGLLLRELVRSPSTPQGIAQRARIILLAGEGMANLAIARKLTIGRPTVLLWRERFKGQGTAGILKIEEGRGRKKEIKAEIVEAIKLLARTEGIFTETAGGVTVAAAKKLIEQGFIPKDESIVISITGNGLKTQEAVQHHIGKPIKIKPTLKSFEESLEL